MKRSRCITLTLLTGATLVVTGCREDEEGKFYKDSATCMAESNDTATCQEAEKLAREDHEQTAPKFTSKADCEKEFGAANCADAPSTPHTASAGYGGGYFMPMMMGYMMGRNGGLFGGGGYAARPIYRDAKNNAYSGGGSGGSAGAFRGGKFEANKSFAGNWFKSGARTTTMSRGGFGLSRAFSGS